MSVKLLSLSYGYAWIFVNEENTNLPSLAVAVSSNHFYGFNSINTSIRGCYDICFL